MENISSVKFNNSKQIEFSTTLRERVSNYFTENNISKYGNASMILKTIIMFLMYFIPYGLSISGIVQSSAGYIALWALMGFGMAGIGLSIMHDANHDAYSKNKHINKILSYTLNVIGGNAVNWKIQHNSLHHIFTNISGKDEDISRIGILRFSPQEKHYKIHRYQHFYAWFLYGLMTLSWVTKKEFVQLIAYKKNGLTQKHGSFSKLLTELVLWKILYFGYTIVLPIMILPFSPWVIIGGFLIMQFIAGFSLSIIFQTAHVMPDNEFPQPDKQGLINENWVVHQLKTTSNFAQNSKFFSWLIGGLNYQVEHHLFPTICHVHYKKISAIVKKTSSEFGIPYCAELSFAQALSKHAKLLKYLGKNH